MLNFLLLNNCGGHISFLSNMYILISDDIFILKIIFVINVKIFIFFIIKNDLGGLFLIICIFIVYIFLCIFIWIDIFFMFFQIRDIGSDSLLSTLLSTVLSTILTRLDIINVEYTLRQNNQVRIFSIILRIFFFMFLVFFFLWIIFVLLVFFELWLVKWGNM